MQLVTRMLRPRFSLLAMLVLITVIAIPLSYVAQRRSWNLRRANAYKTLSGKGVEFRQRGRPNAKVKSEDSNLAKFWRSITADPKAPSFDIITLHESPTGHITDDDLRSLEYFPEIEEVHCHGSADVTDDGLADLSTLPNLKTVVCYYLPNVTGKFLADLRNKSKLECLGFHNCKGLNGQQFAPLSQFQSLKQLNLSDLPTITDESFREVELPSGVFALSVSRVKLGDETLSRWLSQPQFKTLHLHAPITRAIAPAISKQTALESLSIQDAPLIDEDFAFLENCQQLGRVSLISMPVRGELLAFVPNPEKFYSLNFSNTLFCDEHLSKLSRYPNLSALDLAWTPLTGEAFKADIGLPKPGMFFLCGTRFSDAGKEVFSQFKGLSTVQLPSNWSPTDHLRFADSNKPTNAQFNSYFSAPPGGQTWGSPTLRKEPLDNCPSELMKPVADLHAFGDAEEQEIRRRQARGS